MPGESHTFSSSIIKAASIICEKGAIQNLGVSICQYQGSLTAFMQCCGVLSSNVREAMP
jgi:hypothetical protein